MADEKKTEREVVVAYLRSCATDATERAEAWRRRGHEGMTGKKEWESECASQWADAIERGEHDRS